VIGNNSVTTINRNDPCPCGSGKKYKHCCQAKDAAQAASARASKAFIPGTLQMAIGHHQSGRMSPAKTLYQQILQADPAHADALHLLGLIEHQQGNSAHAVALIQKAIQARPTDATFHFNLGNLHQDLAQLNEAIACFEQALLRQPGFVDALLGLGTALKAQGKIAEAGVCFRKVLARQPDRADAHFNLGNTLQMLGQIDEAIACFQQSLLHRPESADTLLGLASALQEKGRIDEAIANYRRALAIKPDISGAYNNLGNALQAQGQLDKAVECYRQAQLLQPQDAYANSIMLFTLQNLSTCSPAELFSEHLRFAERFEAPLKPGWQPHTNNREPVRRLKVGYVSGDFFNHSVAYFIEPILACHDKSRFEIFGYYNRDYHDAHTARIKGHMDHFLVCNTFSDEQLAERIRLDAIDILVDLSGHTAANRLLVFARKPAPVQVNYIGYPGTTGLSAIDYRVSDPWQDPVGLTERYHSEILVRIAGGMAFTPEPDAPAVNPLPALSSGELILACLNNLSKVNPAVIALWARILHALPQARLMLGNVTDSGIRDRLTRLFGEAGIGPERLILQPRVSMAEYLELHHHIDIALDPFPYNGGTTTMHSLWMGVPVITLAGSHAVSRLCAAHLSRVGLPEFITHSEDEYLQYAISFANDLPKLNQVRQSLRQRMNASACDPAAITRQLEAAYRDMWRIWCNS
jgi:predicted O-linked N-acetylglucosamine transferase (SPINDLY family)